jgi:DNA repair protein RadC
MEINLSLEALNNVSEIDIVYRKKVHCKLSDRPQIFSSANAYEVFIHYWNEDTIHLFEEFKVMYLNRSNRVLQIITISRGGICGTVADPRLILAVAIKTAATNIFLAHNHPSGSLKPSSNDEAMTFKIREAAKYLDIKVLDHIIVSSEGYYSFADEGLM